jgi:putative oxidoreductase
VPNLATLRLTWEPRMLSILRIMVGLLYMEHGLAKVLGFPLQPNHAPYALFTLVPGLQGLLELVGGLLLALGLFTRPVAFIRGQHGGRLFHGTCAERFLPATQRWRVGNRLLLRLPLFLGRRGRRVEPRSTARARIRICPLAEPSLSNHRLHAAALRPGAARHGP